MSYRCSLPSPLQKRSKDFKGLQGMDRCQNPAGQQGTFLRMNPWDLLRLPPGLLVLSARASCSDLISSYFGAPMGASDHQSSYVTLKPRRSSAGFWHQCNPLILGSPLQWRWQWASIGHFVFFFFLKISLLEMLRCFWWFKNLYQGQLFNFWSSPFSSKFHS